MKVTIGIMSSNSDEIDWRLKDKKVEDSSQGIVEKSGSYVGGTLFDHH